MNQTLLKKQTKADSFLDFRWLCHWYQGFPCLFIECCFHAYFWCAFSLRRLRLTQGRQDTPSPKYENNIPWTATDIPDINTLHSLSHNLCLRYLDFQKLYNICTIGAHVGRFDLSPPLRPEKGVGGTRALAHSIFDDQGAITDSLFPSCKAREDAFLGDTMRCGSQVAQLMTPIYTHTHLHLYKHVWNIKQICHERVTSLTTCYAKWRKISMSELCLAGCAQAAGLIRALFCKGF